MPETILLQVKREQRESGAVVHQGIPENLSIFLPMESVHMYMSLYNDFLLPPVKATERVFVVLGERVGREKPSGEFLF